MENAYKILGLSQGATDEDIKTAYRRMVKLYHPDLNPDNPEASDKFQEVTCAYEFLIHTHRTSEQPSAPPPKDYGFSTEELLKNIFRSSSASFYDKKQDLAYILKISFLEACYGVTKKIILTGTGDQNSLEISIPAGVEHNQKLRFPPRDDGVNGDIILTVQIADHPLFMREGLDIIFCYPLTVPEYIRGGSFNVPTLWGPVSFNIPPAAPLQNPLRLERCGIESEGTRGDQLIHLEVIYPKNSADLEAVLQKWEEKFPDNPREKLEKFFS
ncbi:MAG: DnaJ C-terminal domain-containing protein [Alphaproteobacteria bacterium]